MWQTRRDKCNISTGRPTEMQRQPAYVWGIVHFRCWMWIRKKIRRGSRWRITSRLMAFTSRIDSTPASKVQVSSDVLHQPLWCSQLSFSRQQSLIRLITTAQISALSLGLSGDVLDVSCHLHLFTCSRTGCQCKKVALRDEWNLDHWSFSPMTAMFSS